MRHWKNRIICSVIFLVLYCIVSGNTATAQEDTLRHVAVALDNYYSLSVRYSVSIAELKNANPGIISPKPGDVIIIPLVTEKTEGHVESDCERLAKNRHEVYRVALLIPLYLEQLSDTIWKYRQEPAKISELAPYRFIQYYHGFMMAADSLRRKGLNVEIHVYDVDNLAVKANAVINKPEMKKMDLIFGPFFRTSFSIVAEFAKENRIPVINPLSSRLDILEDNPYVFKPVPSVESQPDIVARLVKREFSDNRIIFYVSNKYQNSDLIGRYKTAIEETDPSGSLVVTVIDFASDSLRGFSGYASRSQPNLVIIYSENEVLPAALLGKLNALKGEYQLSVIGLPEWQRFINMESAYLMAMNTHVLMSSYTDFQENDVKGFIGKYRSLYFDEPQEYAFGGFDAGYYFLSALLLYGHDFSGCIGELRIPLIQNSFHFGQQGNNGYDNLNWNVVQYLDYFLLKKSL